MPLGVEPRRLIWPELSHWDLPEWTRTPFGKAGDHGDHLLPFDLYSTLQVEAATLCPTWALLTIRIRGSHPRPVQMGISHSFLNLSTPTGTCPSTPEVEQGLIRVLGETEAQDPKYAKIIAGSGCTF